MACSNSSALGAPTINVNVPADAAFTPPETGASTKQDAPDFWKISKQIAAEFFTDYGA